MAPSKISRHEIKEMIARGGLATVYLAFDPGSKRDVAELPLISLMFRMVIKRFNDL
jgi:hypothetical protein